MLAQSYPIRDVRQIVTASRQIVYFVIAVRLLIPVHTKLGHIYDPSFEVLVVGNRYVPRGLKTTHLRLGDIPGDRGRSRSALLCFK